MTTLPVKAKMSQEEDDKEHAKKKQIIQKEMWTAASVWVQQKEMKRRWWQLYHRAEVGGEECNLRSTVIDEDLR